jgi:hypothetical protein
MNIWLGLIVHKKVKLYCKQALHNVPVVITIRTLFWDPPKSGRIR